MKKLLLVGIIIGLWFVGMKEMAWNKQLFELDILLTVGSLVIFKEFVKEQISWFLF